MVFQTEQNNVYNEFDDLEQTRELFKNCNNFIASNIVKFIDNDVHAILDFGAGVGTLVDLIKQKRSELIIDAIELDPRHRDILNSKGISNYLSLSDVPQMYDMVYSSNVLEHIADDLQIIRDIYQIIKPGGKFILYLPALNLLRTDWDDKIGHYRRYSKQDLSSKLINAGFKVTKAKYVDSVGGILALIYKYQSKPANHNPLIQNSRGLMFYDRVLFKFNWFSDLLTGQFFGKNIFVVAQKE